MGGIFASPKSKENKEEISYDKAVLDLKVTRDKLKKYKQRLEQENEKSIQLAKKLASEGKKDRAKLLIKMKIQKEASITKVEGMLENCQTQLNKLEEASINKMVVESLQNTNTILKKMTEEMSVEKVEALMEENEEQNEKLQEVVSLLSQNMSQEENESIEEEYEQMLAQLGLDEGTEEKPAQQEEEQQEEEPEAQKPTRIAALA